MKRNIFKKPFFRAGQLGGIFSALIVCLSCGTNFSDINKEENVQKVKVMNWNLQTFFDSNFDGNEYTEFKNAKSGWSQEKYEIRLERLANVIREIDADIVIMEELEKEAQLQDIANRLSGTFDFSKIYTHALFSSSEGSSIGCGVLSRFPIGEITVHGMDIRLAEKQPAMRPIIQFSVYVKNKTLTIFVNHWKSKSGGEEKSEVWRKRQENLLAGMIFKAVKRGNSVLAAGDFNKDISEFDYCEKGKNSANIILHGKTDAEVFSPWILESGEYIEEGSYWYKNNWERIDHFFAAGKTVISNFCPENSGEWVDQYGHPARYQLWNGKGYSDHFPISCTVEF